ncbi:MAG: hypothetical protein WD013_01395 [Gemmatimonadota bacterium]
MPTSRFWTTSSGVALILAGGWAVVAPALSWLEPRAGLRFPAPVEMWLLGVFTAGVLLVLLGLSVTVGGRLPGVRAREALARLIDGSGAGPAGTPAESDNGDPHQGWWSMTVGANLLAIYLLGWIVLR